MEAYDDVQARKSRRQQTSLEIVVLSNKNLTIVGQKKRMQFQGIPEPIDLPLIQHRMNEKIKLRIQEKVNADDFRLGIVDKKNYPICLTLHPHNMHTNAPYTWEIPFRTCLPVRQLSSPCLSFLWIEASDRDEGSHMRFATFSDLPLPILTSLRITSTCTREELAWFTYVNMAHH
ncbi:hypothetical protein Cgig2_031122 [Carnegiea gigantea]|uniref:Uncharacterized protein n=1 Tax=Carnegiea gigantea TaxID=171969 RepID=A0A9Q1JLU6_9CARY|nr:hypothetical protein Cgig2_031122 [Carnegiea gigantea]